MVDELPQVMYHVADAADRDSIAAHGIDFHLGEQIPMADDADRPEGNYLWPVHASWINPGGHADVWEVDVEGYDVELDPYTERYGMGEDDTAYYIETPIMPADVRLIHEGRAAS